jgi:hypothetical protein
MSYDRTKETTKADVKREFAEFGEAVKHGTVKQAAKEGLEAVGAAADLVVDSARSAVEGVKRYFKAKTGYSLHDPEQDVHVQPHLPTEAVETQWVKDRVAEGLVEEVAAPEPVAEVAPKPAE